LAATRVVIDTDPGVDDAVAILLALASPEIDVVGLTTVNGNVSLESTTRNARRLLALAGRTDVPVAPGADKPLTGAAAHASEVHGRDGLADLSWPDVVSPAIEQGAVSLLTELARAGPLTIVAIGPLTNIAYLVAERPDVVTAVERLVVMGGASFHGNVTPAAEFNIWVDPEAARAVFAAPWRSVDLMPLDLTHQAYLTDADLAYFRGLPGDVGTRIADILEPYAAFHERWHGNRNLIMHDATAVYDVIDPTAIMKQGVVVHVETAGEYARGATFIHRSHEHEHNAVRVGVAIDNEAFVELVRTRLATYS
jgi:purine nucleosidase